MIDSDMHARTCLCMFVVLFVVTDSDSSDSLLHYISFYLFFSFKLPVSAIISSTCTRFVFKFIGELTFLFHRLLLYCMYLIYF